MLHRFHRPGPFEAGQTLTLEGDELHHAVKVRRLKVNELIEIFDGEGIGVLARVTFAGRERLEAVVVEVVTESRESEIRIELAMSLIQQDRFELVLQKGTELGVSTFIPLETSRSELSRNRASSRTDRWRRILLEATKQCGRHRIPVLREITDFDSALEFDGTAVVLDGDSPSDHLRGHHPEVRLLVGPEGGWDPDEIERARARGARFLRLGPRRLRAETAAIAAVTLLGIGSFGR